MLLFAILSSPWLLFKLLVLPKFPAIVEMETDNLDKRDYYAILGISRNVRSKTSIFTIRQI